MAASLIGFLVFFTWLVPQSAHAPVALFKILDLREKPKATVIFGGDLMFDRFVRKRLEAYGEDHVFSCIADVLRSADLVVANLEGPITPHPSVSASSTVGTPENMTFTFPVSTAGLLSRHNIRMVHLGNNHIGNYGEEGIRSTMEALAENEVGFFGSPLQSSLTRRAVEGIQFEFISYNEFGGGGEGELTAYQIKYARQEGFFPIVFAHWGEEYSTTSLERIEKLARGFVDAGAGLVIGSHPHVVQEHEVYGDTHIYYSLGNFVFDQYWDEHVRSGLLVRVIFSERGVLEVEELPITMHRDGRTCLSER